MIRIVRLSALLALTVLLAGCGGNGASQLTESEQHLRQASSGLGAPEDQRSGWANNLTSSLLNFEVPWGSRETQNSSHSYVNAMFRRRFDSQEARYNAMVDDATRAELALESFVISAREVVEEDEERLAGLIALMAGGTAQSDDIAGSMERIRRNRLAVDEGLVEARTWEQTFIEVRDRANLELPNSTQAAQLSRSVSNMDRWINELTGIADRMGTSTERVAAEFMDRN